MSLRPKKCHPLVVGALVITLGSGAGVVARNVAQADPLERAAMIASTAVVDQDERAVQSDVQEEQVVRDGPQATTLLDGRVLEVADLTATTAKAALSKPSTVATVLSKPTKKAHRMYVVRVSDSKTKGEPSKAAIAKATKSAGSYWVKQSRGMITSFKVASTRTLKLSSSCKHADTDLWKRAQKLYPKVNFSAANHLVVFLPQGCERSLSYSGLGTIGSGLNDGGLTLVDDTYWATLAHELGHTMGLRHANMATSTSSKAHTYEYLGRYDVMGSIGQHKAGALSAAALSRLRLPGATSQVREVVAASSKKTTTLTLRPVDSTSGVKAATFLDPSTGKRIYVEYRSGRSQDAGAFYTTGLAQHGGNLIGSTLVTFEPGVHVTRVESDGSVTTLAHKVSGRLRTTMTKGQALTGASSSYKVKVVSISKTAARVQITVAGVKAKTSKVSLKASPGSFGTDGSASVSVTSSRAPAGRVDLFRGSTKVASGSLVDGMASFTLPKTWAAGTYNLTAKYVGTAFTKPSSASVSYKVAKATAFVGSS